jgi:hypothetical protein
MHSAHPARANERDFSHACHPATPAIVIMDAGAALLNDPPGLPSAGSSPSAKARSPERSQRLYGDFVPRCRRVAVERVLELQC